MTLSKGFVQNAATTPLDARRMDMGKYVCNADGSPRTGVLGGANASIVATTGTMNVTVAAAEFVLSKGKADGVTTPLNDGSVNVLIGAAPGSNSRIDVIWVKHEDTTTGDVGGDVPIFGVTAGTAAASPTAPAIPTGALELAQLRIYAGTVATNGGSNVLTNTYQMTASRGGVVPFRTKAELDLWTNPCDGQDAYVIAESRNYRRLTSAWRPVSDDTGWATLTLSNSWVDYGSGYTSARYRRLNGVVYVEGLVKLGTLTSGTVLSNLPAGFRPTTQKIFPAISNLSTIGSVEVTAAGNVQIASVASNASLSLEAIRFIAEA